MIANIFFFFLGFAAGVAVMLRYGEGLKLGCKTLLGEFGRGKDGT